MTSICIQYTEVSMYVYRDVADLVPSTDPNDLKYDKNLNRNYCSTSGSMSSGEVWENP